MSPPIRKQVVRPLSVSHWMITNFHQIIEEQLAFPSGTATAHLISVLHKLPPPEGTLRSRTGYEPIDDEEHVADETDHEPSEDDALIVAEQEMVQETGWHALLWSFASSGLMTVSKVVGQLINYIPPTFTLSWLRTSFRLYLQFLSLETTWRENGYGASPPAFHTLGRVSSWDIL